MRAVELTTCDQNAPFWILFEKINAITCGIRRLAKKNNARRPGIYGTSGIDGESFASIELFGLSKYLAILQKGLYVPTHASKAGVYPEAEWNDARVGHPSIRDRIVHGAFVMVLEPIFEADFMASSYGFRPEKSAHDAVRCSP